MPIKQIEQVIDQAKLGHRTAASNWLRILDKWITDHQAGLGEGLPATLDQAEDLMRRLREALAIKSTKALAEEMRQRPRGRKR